MWKEVILPPLLSTGDATPGVLYTPLDYTVQDRHGHTEKSPKKGSLRQFWNCVMCHVREV